MPVQNLKREPVSAQVLRQIRELIESGEWPVGHRLPGEQQLATEFGVGRSSIREAIGALGHSGMLEARPGDGTFVRATTELEGVIAQRAAVSPLLEVYEVRRSLEVEASRLAATRRTGVHLERMLDALEARLSARISGNVNDFQAADISFHLAVIDAAGNPILAELYHGFTAALREALASNVEQNAPGFDTPEFDTDELHGRLYDAIAAKDPLAAVRATEEHLASTVHGMTHLA